MVRDGIYYATGFAAAALLVDLLTGSIWLALPMLVLAGFFAWFFRDPERPIPAGPFALSPADGKVVAVIEEEPGVKRVSIFLNIFDVHVNRAPISGIITDVEYTPGTFGHAGRPAASARNESNRVTIHGEDTRVVFKQIAGLMARRIVFSKKAGDYVSAGERVGMIKFGSRVDVLFGPEWHLEVKQGMRVTAGSSVLARRGGWVEPVKMRQAPIEEPALCAT